MAKRFLEFTAAEVEFLAEDTIITIVPNFQMDMLFFISGTVGPFSPSLPVQVPVWLACTLKTRKRCSIQAPEWLDVAYLSAKLDEERMFHDRFIEMPEHFMEISAMLLECASDDIRNASQLRGIIEDICEIRYAKARHGLSILQDNPVATQVNNLSLMEINSIRPFFIHAMNEFRNFAQTLQATRIRANEVP
ncbi:Psf2 [Capsaspora owczarzaki ATCC 30864]|uniref:DNA replication complex GINS protein PSF2 n=1 Tax=Capsaspora owczarzaki (strain ATCC 30864) TaxID=595528 RepID=A0A0D2UAN6_CAPO3|nr:Psf2 [Capsaspora owczarzaki ATCC 30864]KJE92086.1 Psf2 [Capsaspora owczarzaki ATCC 30864]|eukprot:XP_004363952.1 Psf2 [Capsaspora owczarzaki ATCC 30864]